MSTRPSRRSVLRTGGWAAAAGTGALAGFGAGRGSIDAVGTTTSAPSLPVPFHGAVQAGVREDPPLYATWVGLDLADDAGADDLRGLLTTWTDDFSRLMAGRVTLSDLSTELGDPGCRLSLTLGVGPRVPKIAGRDDSPPWLAPLPAFKIDKFEKPWVQTDLVIQVRGDDPLTVRHAVQDVTDSSRGAVRIRWFQRGYRARARPRDLGITRNAFGQLDGMVNPAVDSDAVWCRPGLVPQWLAGGTSLVLRRIRMDVTTWAGVDRAARENAVGRTLSDGSPMTGGGPGATPDLNAKDDLGFPVIDDISHMRRAMPRNPQERILRAPYTYDDSTAERTDVGLIFAAYQSDPVKQFVPIQQRLAQADLMNVWTTPIGSAVYAILPGVAVGGHLGQGLV